MKSVVLYQFSSPSWSGLIALDARTGAAAGCPPAETGVAAGATGLGTGRDCDVPPQRRELAAGLSHFQGTPPAGPAPVASEAAAAFSSVVDLESEGVGRLASAGCSADAPVPTDVWEATSGLSAEAPSITPNTTITKARLLIRNGGRMGLGPEEPLLECMRETEGVGFLTRPTVLARARALSCRPSRGPLAGRSCLLPRESDSAAAARSVRTGRSAAEVPLRRWLSRKGCGPGLKDSDRRDRSSACQPGPDQSHPGGNAAPRV